MLFSQPLLLLCALRLFEHSDELLHCARQISVLLSVEIDFSAGQILVEPVEPPLSIIMCLADKCVCDQRNSHTVAGNPVSSDLLIQL